jgi:large subunit ribosomal protein L23
VFIATTQNSRNILICFYKKIEIEIKRNKDTMSSRKFTRPFRMWMPTMPLTMVSARSATETSPAYATFRTPPKMTKHEIKEYLTKIYDLPVRKVNTMNYEGKRKRVIYRDGRGVAHFKYKDFKKAVVYFNDSLQNVGIGMRIPELDEVNEDESDEI